jgi:type IV pilus assembly protein PilX
MHLAGHPKQQGAALIVSLIILLILTILGVSSLSNSGLESRMAHNFQLSNYVFHGAESAIEGVLITTTVDDNPAYYQPNDLLITAMNAGMGDTSTTSSYDPDPNGYLGAATISAGSTIVYQSESPCPGTSFGEIVCHQFEITSTATMTQTGANDTHILGVQRMAPGNI